MGKSRALWGESWFRSWYGRCRRDVNTEGPRRNNVWRLIVSVRGRGTALARASGLEVQSCPGGSEVGVEESSETVRAAGSKIAESQTVGGGAGREAKGESRRCRESLRD